MDKHIEQAAARALLDRGAAFHIPAPFLFRIFGKKRVRIVVKQLRLGALLYLTEIPGWDDVEDLNVGDDAEQVIRRMSASAVSIAIKSIESNRKAVVRAVSACLLNSRWKIKLFRTSLSRYLMNVLTVGQLQELVMWLVIYGRLEPFMTIIKLLLTMKVTSPMNLSQKKIKRS